MVRIHQGALKKANQALGSRDSSGILFLCRASGQTPLLHICGQTWREDEQQGVYVSAHHNVGTPAGGWESRRTRESEGALPFSLYG